jgi:AraC-like DNA-binding protein
MTTRAPKFGSYRSTDVNETTAFYRELGTQISIDTPPDAPPFIYHVDHVQLSSLQMAVFWRTADMALHSEFDAYTIAGATAGHASFEQRRSHVVTSPTTAIVHDPHAGPLVSHISAGSRLFTVVIDRRALVAHLEALLDRPVSTTIRLAPSIDLTTSAGDGWNRQFHLLASGVHNRDNPLYQPMIAEPLCHALLSGLLLACDHPYRDALNRPATPSRPRIVKHAIDAMHAHPEHPYTTATLASLAGTSERTLQEGFRRHVGVTPMAYLRQVRLARAHDDLLAARVSTVAEAAHRWGFTHLGRFAAIYRARYGVTPTTTLHLS